MIIPINLVICFSVVADPILIIAVLFLNFQLGSVTLGVGVLCDKQQSAKTQLFVSTDPINRQLEIIFIKLELLS